LNWLAFGWEWLGLAHFRIAYAVCPVQFRIAWAIKFFFDEGVTAVQIVVRLKHHYGEGVLSRTQVYFWINGIKRGRRDLNIIASPERRPDEGFAAVIAGKLDANLHLSAKKYAQSLGIAASTVCRCLTEVLGIMYWDLCWVPHTLTHAQNVMCTELAQSMFQTLAKHEHTNYHFLFTGDGSWIFMSMIIE
jgi:hypothetical protein